MKSLGVSLSPLTYLAFIADDVCVCQAPRRPNPLSVYYASETAEAIHTRSLLGKRQKSGVTVLRVFGDTKKNLITDRRLKCAQEGSESAVRVESG